GRSALTVTPFTGAIVPIAASVPGHFPCCATIVVTASGGGVKPAACTDDWICRNLKKPTPPMKAAATTNIRIIRFAMRSSQLVNHNCGNYTVCRYIYEVA